MSTQFISCSDAGCPLNDMKTCRAPFIFVNAEGACRVRGEGPHGNKREIEGYVDLRECRCSRCNYWELDERTRAGQCAAREDLFFFVAARDVGRARPVCNNFRKQIEQPGFTARLEDPGLVPLQ